MGVHLPAQEEAPKDFMVWPENWEIVELFIACQTQWVWSFDGATKAREGLNYSSVMSVVTAWGVEDTRAMLDGIRVMEASVLAVWSGKD